MNFPTASKRKLQPPRIARLDGRPQPKPRGRHAVKRAEGEAEPEHETVTIPVNQRLGFRVREFAALCGVSYVTIWRQIGSKKIPVIEVRGVKLVPRAYAIERGLITSSDAV